MCGIAGIIGKQTLSRDEIQLTLDSFKNSLRHRGPNDFGEHIGINCGFLNRRLSIVDIEHGKQPIYNSNKTCGIVYNGEIYNYKELRSEAINKGYVFSTSTDTEAVLKCYELSGTQSFKNLNGMFAFCMWDDRDNCIYLVRDCFGIKPLYIYEDDKKIIFSSEIQGILKIPGLDLTYDPCGFQDYFCFRYIQAPYTLYKKIRKLDAGYYVKIKDGRCQQYAYSTLTYDIDHLPKNGNELTEELLSTLEDVVRSQLMGEVPIGVLLSGGIDSSLISYMVKKCGANLKTFNIGFPEDNEFEYSKIVASSLGLDHMEIVVRVQDIIRDFDEIIRNQDEPLSDAACFPLYILAKEIKKHVTVVLSGEGGDELFGGYPQYTSILKSKSSIDTFDLFLAQSQYYLNHKDFLNDKTLAPSHFRNKKYFNEPDVLNGMLHYDMKTWVPDDLMMKADKTLMAHSLEGRFPFLDKRMFGLAAKLPVNYKIPTPEETKWVLKKSCSDILPNSIIYRKKKGFSVPIDYILKAMKDKVIDTFNTAKSTSISDVVNMQTCENVINQYYSGAESLHLRTWNMFILFSKVIR